MSDLKLDTKEADRILQVLDKNKKKLGKLIAFEIEGEAKRRAVRATGAMSNSIYTVTQDEDGYTAASNSATGANSKAETAPHPKPRGNVIANVGPAVIYAEFVELGTSKMSAQPFLVPAAESVFNKFNSGEYWRGLVK